MDFDGKVVWITGASSGIGAELARQLSSRGSQLVLSARREKELEKVRTECANSDMHWVEPLDLGDSAGFEELVENVWSETGGVDILINNGAVGQRGMAMETTLEVDRMVMEVNFLGVVALTKPVVTRMLERGGGAVVSVSSLLGKFGTQLRSSYAASKHALGGFMDCLRTELSGTGVTVHVVYPGWVVSDIGKNAVTSDGSAYSEPDSEVAKGMPTAVFVKKMLAELEKDKAEFVIAEGKALLGYHFHRLTPNLFHWGLPRIYKRQG
jgi:short-subunit dehydrogenase